MPGSDYKIFANFDAAEGVMTVSTQASEMFTSRDASCMFQNFQQVAEIVNLPALNTSKAKTMKKMFSQDTTSAAKLVTLDLSGFDAVLIPDVGGDIGAVPDAVFPGGREIVLPQVNGARARGVDGRVRGGLSCQCVPDLLQTAQKLRA